jgi:hypothetical protein
MKALRIAFALTMGILGGVLLAQSEGDFPGWMKQVAKSNGALKGAVASKDAKTVETEAKNMESIFKQVEAAFSKMNIPDGAAKAKEVHTAAAATAKAAASGTIDEADATKVMGSCAGCHMAHREKGADGSYKVKK